MILDGFCDVDWAGQPHRHLISGYSFHMGTSAITWSLKKQYIVTLSSTEVKYIAQTHTMKEVMYLCTFMGEINGFDKLVTLKCDNQGAITLSKDNKFHAWTKHIDIWYFFIQVVVENEKISIKYVSIQCIGATWHTGTRWHSHKKTLSVLARWPREFLYSQ